MDYAKVVDALAADDKQRVDFMKACLSKVGLQVNPENEAVPSLSRIHLSAAPSSDIEELVSGWTEILTSEHGQDYIKAEHDTFQLEKQSTWNLANVAKALPEVVQSAMNATPGLATSGDLAAEAESKTEEAAEEESGIVDYDKIIKRIVAHGTSLPESKETPYFNHHAFFANLQHYNSVTRTHDATFGRVLMYGEVVTSTNTLLEKYVTIHPILVRPLSHLHSYQTLPLSNPPSHHIPHPASSSGFLLFTATQLTQTPKKEPHPPIRPTNRHNPNSNNPTRRSWPRLQHLGLPPRQPDVQHHPAAPTSPQHFGTSSIHPIPMRTCHNPRNLALRPRWLR